MIPDLLKVSARDLLRRIPLYVSEQANRKTLNLNRFRLDEEIRSMIQFRMTKLRELTLEPSLYNVLINTPEFSRFVFAVPGVFLFGVSVISFSGATTMPLIFEKMIPYHIKTISIASSFYAFTDLATNVIGRPTITSHHRWKKSLFMMYGIASLFAATAVMSIGDKDPHRGYNACIGLLALNTVPLIFSPLQAWIRVWRIGFLSLGLISVIGAKRKLSYLESHWDEMVMLS